RRSARAEARAPPLRPGGGVLPRRSRARRLGRAEPAVGVGADAADARRARRAGTVARPDRAPRGVGVTDAPVATSHRVGKMASHPSGALEDDDFALVDERVPEPADGEALVRTLYLSLDPAIRVWMNGID